ncbi:DUF4296 domain-containing protein [Mariniflexile jejuense]|uniref:DUF4296 domain-containing protein n=1 Tax=Mariniflexile jejuense TaxID=1173582 RepID=UPI0036D265A6
MSVILSVTACGFGGPDKPKNLISKKTMVNILIDARLIGSAPFTSKQKMEDKGVNLNTYVFEKYGIDSLQFALSNEYYAYNLKDYEEIYSKVTDSLEKLKKTLKALQTKEEKEKKQMETDSINALKTKDSLKADEFRKKKLDYDEGVLIKPVSDKTSQSRK